MAKIARAFDKHRHEEGLRSKPQQLATQDNDRPPWEIIPQNAMPPMMFQLRYQDGSKNSFSYSDLREVYCRDAGFVALSIQSIAKYRIVIEGRHLGALADWFGLGTVRWVQEGDHRADPKPESAPEVLKITTELIPD